MKNILNSQKMLMTKRAVHAQLLNAFDFSQKPRAPHIIPLSQAQIDAVKRYIEVNSEQEVKNKERLKEEQGTSNGNTLSLACRYIVIKS